MIVEMHDRLQSPLRIKATRVLITAEDGTPIAFVVEYTPGHYRAFHAGDKDFVNQLKMHNIDRTVIVNHMDFSKDSPNIFRGTV